MNHAAPHSFPNHGAHRVCVARYVASDGALSISRPAPVDASETDRFTLEPAAQAGWGPNRAFRIPWGAPLREACGKVSAQIDGRWQDVETIAGVTRDQICSMYKTLFRGDSRVPDRWVFNDFHRSPLFRFVDSEHDLTEDAGARRPGELVMATASSTPASATLLWVQKKMSPLAAISPEGGWRRLSYSHGCLHLRRPDMEELIDRGFVEHGGLLVVHPGPERPMEVASVPTWSEGPYELHFYPRDESIYVYGWQPERRGRSTSV